MLLSRLSLANFRNYRQLDLQLPAPVALFQGDNGQGKTNLLEAAYFLATTRSLRASSDRELINWSALEEPIPFARVEGTVRKARADLRVEVVIRGDRPERQRHTILEGSATPVELSKRIKVNGVPKRALDLIGQINIVMFSPQDLDLVSGAPALRRRYMDIVDCQVDHRYCRTLQQYNRVLAQRNHLLKQIRDNRQPPEMLDYWSEELINTGAYLLHLRLGTVAALNQRIDGYFHRITASGKTLRVTYHSSVEEAAGDAGTGGRGEWESGRAGDPAAGQSAPPYGSESPDGEEAGVRHQAELFRLALARFRRREMIHGVSLVGPHRDDLAFRADGIDMNVYGSRGEQRAVALALKLSEVEFIQASTGEQPILLLDDVMSELDPSRRGLLMAALNPAGQTLISATDVESFPADFLSSAAVFSVQDGAVTRLS